MDNMIKSINLKNFRGIDNLKISFECFIPGKIQLAVGYNGCGKTTITNAFENFQTNKFVFDKNDCFQKDITKEPSMTIEYREDGHDYSLKCDKNQNQISDFLKVVTVSTKYIPKASNRRINGHNFALPSFKPIYFEIKRLSDVTVKYKYSDIKYKLPNSSKCFPNLADFFKDINFVRYYIEYIMQKIGQKRLGNLINQTLNELESIGTQYNKSQIIQNLKNFELIKMLLDSETFQSILSAFPINTLSENERILAVIELFIANIDSKEIKARRDYLENSYEINACENLLKMINSTGRPIYRHEKDKLIVNVNDVSTISNGERDLIILVGRIFEEKYSNYSKRKLFVMDGIFDYLDGANLAAFQYLLTKEFKETFKNDYFLLFTHLDPFYFKNFAMSDSIKISYFEKKGINYTHNFLDNVNRRTSLGMDDKNYLDKYFFHFHPDKSDIAETPNNKTAVQTFFGYYKTNKDFYKELATEIQNYKNDTNYDIVKLCLALRIACEIEMYNCLNTSEKTIFLNEHGKKKYDYIESISTIPTHVTILRPIYNDIMHVTNENKEGKIKFPVMFLNNLFIKNVIKRCIDETTLISI